MSNARKIAVEILYDIEIKKAYSNILLNKKVKHIDDSRDEKLIRELVYGVLENKLFIDNIIKNFSKTKLKKIDKKILQILRIGIYQIYFINNIPDRAACNESVNLTKRFKKNRLSGYVNGILRNISRNKNKDFLPDKTKDYETYLSIKYSHPKWIVDKFKKDYGKDFTEKLLIANNEKPPLTIRVNTLKTTKKELMNKLKNYNFNIKETKYSNDGLIIENPKQITTLKEFKNGLFTIQDESSMLVAEIMDPVENSKVLDVCSAPGGKATHIGEKMNNNGLIIARDIFEHKLKLINKNSNRLGIKIINTELQDALELKEQDFCEFDYCLVDAPCSGLGLLRRKPDIRWNKSYSDIENLTKVQYKIIKNASKYVKKGGILIYSTCTLSKSENIDLINKFLDNNENYELVPITNVNILNSYSLSEGYIELYPHKHGTDGFFIAKMRRKS